MKFYLKFKENQKKLIDPVCMVVRKALLTSLRRFAIIGVVVHKDNNGELSSYNIMDSIEGNTITPLDFAVSLSKNKVYIKEDVVTLSEDGNHYEVSYDGQGSIEVNNDAYIVYTRRLSNCREIKISDFSDIIEPMDTYKDTVLARFNDSINIVVTFYIADISSDIDRMESKSVIESADSNNDKIPIVTLPGVLLPSDIIIERDDVNLDATFTIDVPHNDSPAHYSLELQIKRLIKSDISEIFASLVSL